MAGPLFQTTPMRPTITKFGLNESSPNLASDVLVSRPMSEVKSPLEDFSKSKYTRVIIHNLPEETSEQSIRFMLAWTRQPHTVTLLPPDRSGNTELRTALLTLPSLELAQEVKKMYHGIENPSQNGQMAVEIVGETPLALDHDEITNHRAGYIVDGGRSRDASDITTMGNDANITRVVTLNSHLPPSRFGSIFQSFDKSTSIPPGERYMATSDVPNIFSPQSPIGNHLTERSRITGKALITNESADDDDNGELLLKQSLPYTADDIPLASNNLQRRATAPQLPISRMAGLSLNTGLAVASSLPGIPPNAPSSSHQSHMLQKQHQLQTHQPAHLKHRSGIGSPHANHTALSPNIHPAGTMSPIGSMSTFGLTPAPIFTRSHFPAANPADQNPPCNTLYVGNLPIDTSEEELKAMFSKQRGYKRLCFRTKSNGPMCFVEFEDVSFATKALNELYGQMLHNSVKGGIRLSFSKNPLGVRSGQTLNQLGSSLSPSVGTMYGSGAVSLNSPNGPPPGLSLPPGLTARGVGFGHVQALATVTTAGSTQLSHHSLHSPHFTGGPYSPPPSSHSWNTYSPAFNSDSPSNSQSGFTPPPHHNPSCR